MLNAIFSEKTAVIVLTIVAIAVVKVAVTQLHTRLA